MNRSFHILLVEDESDKRKAFKENLENSLRKDIETPFKIECAKNLDEAVKKISGLELGKINPDDKVELHNFDFIIADFKLENGTQSEMGGYALALFAPDLYQRSDEIPITFLYTTKLDELEKAPLGMLSVVVLRKRLGRLSVTGYNPFETRGINIDDLQNLMKLKRKMLFKKLSLTQILNILHNVSKDEWNKPVLFPHNETISLGQLFPLKNEFPDIIAKEIKDNLRNIYITKLFQWWTKYISQATHLSLGDLSRKAREKKSNLAGQKEDFRKEIYVETFDRLTLAIETFLQEMENGNVTYETKSSLDAAENKIKAMIKGKAGRGGGSYYNLSEILGADSSNLTTDELSLIILADISLLRGICDDISQELRSSVETRMLKVVEKYPYLEVSSDPYIFAVTHAVDIVFKQSQERFETDKLSVGNWITILEKIFSNGWEIYFVGKDEDGAEQSIDLVTKTEVGAMERYRENGKGVFVLRIPAGLRVSINGRITAIL